MRRYSKPIEEMIHEAIKSLGGEGSIKQVTDQIRLLYPEDKIDPSTISTMMSDLSVNGPRSSSYPSERKFLLRVGRGYYRMVMKEDISGLIEKTNERVKSRFSEELFREQAVQEVLRNWFENRGYVVIQRCIDDPTSFTDIRDCKTSNIFGIDIVAQKGCEKWIVEVKGETKGGTASGNVDLMCGVGQLLTYMTKLDDNIHYAIAIPNTPHFANSLKKLQKSAAIARIKLNLFLMGPNGTVMLKKPEDFHIQE